MITREKVQELNHLALERPVAERYIYLGDALSYCEQLLKERDEAIEDIKEKELEKEALLKFVLDQSDALKKQLEIARGALLESKEDIIRFKETSKMRLYPTLETIDKALAAMGEGEKNV